MKRIVSNDFHGLMENLKCETGNDNQIIGFRSKFKNFEISFHACNEDGYDLIVEDFGQMVSGKWVQIVPLAYQIDEMNDKIFKKMVEVAEDRRIENKNQIDREMHMDKYGNEGAIYSKYY